MPSSSQPIEGFDLDAPWALAPQVAIRPESFGALAYHFGTRRLSFLKSLALRDVVVSLEQHSTGREACEAAGIGEHELPAYERSLGVLAKTQMIVQRGGA